MLGKREQKACDTCRKRKVRCNVSSIGSSCSNCTRADVVCSFKTAWGKQPPEQRRRRTIVPPANTHTFKVSVPNTDNSPNDDATIVVATALEQPSPQDIRRNATEDRSAEIASKALPPNKLELPDYITPLPKSIDRHVLHLLHQKGALAVPQKVMVDELLRGFLCYVYPLLPVVDLDSFFGAMSGNGKTISLLLFQAVVMAGAIFADLSRLQYAESQSQKDLQRIYFERVKLLYGMDVESNPTTLIQVLLLMTFWHGQLNDTKGRFYWLSIALSLAAAAGLDDPRQDPDQPDRRRFRRRLWACCIMRSRLLSLMERRQVPHECVAKVSEAFRPGDMDDLALTRAFDKYYLPGCELEAKAITQLFMQKIKLCGIIRHVFASQYHAAALSCVESSETVMVLIPTTKNLSSYVIARDQELRKWCEETSSNTGFAIGKDHSSNGAVLGVHSASLEMLYLTVVSAVHRPNLLHHQSTDSAAGALQAFSCFTTRSAARRITDIARQLDDGNLVRFLPPLAVGALTAASIHHLKDLMTTDSHLHGEGSLYLNQTLHALAALRTRYNSADSAIGFIETVKSGQAFPHSFGWDDRVHPVSRPDNNSGSYSTEEPQASTTAETSPLWELTVQGGDPTSTEHSHGAVPRIFHDSNEFFNMAYLTVPNLEGFSEELIANLYGAQIESAMG